MTTGRLVEISVFLASESTAGVSSRNFTVTNSSNSLTYTVASSFVCISPLAVTTVTAVLEIRSVSNSAELKSFLLSMHIAAPESTIDSFSLLWIRQGWRWHTPKFTRREEGSSLRFLDLPETFGQSPRIFAGASLLLSCLFLRHILEFGSVRASLRRFCVLKHP